ncbi:hypothetical protein [Nostoc sp. FACHB-888]|nr:hypothetical protein [Nostoc sp. FACHB-888]MBD2249461.1 hypothetical protein [Nostoc sp. FACHB-888]
MTTKKEYLERAIAAAKILPAKPITLSNSERVIGSYLFNFRSVRLVN